MGRADMRQIQKHFDKNFFVAQNTDNDTDNDTPEILGTVAVGDSSLRSVFNEKCSSFDLSSALEVKSLVVKKSARFQGVAKALMQFAEEYARKKNSDLWLWTASAKYGTLKFYKKQRYQQEEVHWYSDGNRFKDCINFLLGNYLTVSYKSLNKSK